MLTLDALRETRTAEEAYRLIGASVGFTPGHPNGRRMALDRLSAGGDWSVLVPWVRETVMPHANLIGDQDPMALARRSYERPTLPVAGALLTLTGTHLPQWGRHDPALDAVRRALPTSVLYPIARSTVRWPTDDARAFHDTMRHIVEHDVGGLSSGPEETMMHPACAPRTRLLLLGACHRLGASYLALGVLRRPGVWQDQATLRILADHYLGISGSLEPDRQIVGALTPESLAAVITALLERAQPVRAGEVLELATGAQRTAMRVSPELLSRLCRELPTAARPLVFDLAPGLRATR